MGERRSGLGLAALSLIVVLALPLAARAASLPGVVAFSGLNGIFLVQPGAPGTERSIYPVQGALTPTWSPNGRELAFLAPDGSRTWKIVVTDRNGAHARTLASGAADVEGAVAWSPNGREIAYACDTTQKGTADDGYRVSQLCVLDVSGGHHRMVTRPSDSNGLALTGNGFQRLSWSANGQEIAATVVVPQTCAPAQPPFTQYHYCSREEVGLVNANSGAYTLLTNHGADVPAFSPDGQQIVYYDHTSDHGEPTGVVVMKANGDGAHSIVPVKDILGTGFRQAGQPDPIFSPDGRDILYAADHQGYMELFVIPVHGGHPEQWTHHGNDIYDAAWTPILTDCTVPKLKGKTLAQAKKLLRKAACTLGKVTGPKQHRSQRHIVAQNPKPNRELPEGSRVSVRVG